MISVRAAEYEFTIRTVPCACKLSWSLIGALGVATTIGVDVTAAVLVDATVFVSVDVAVDATGVVVDTAEASG